MVEGWGWIKNSPKWHYFIDGRSLCGRWAYFDRELEQENDESPDNCTACKKALAKRKAKQALDKLKSEGKITLEG